MSALSVPNTSNRGCPSSLAGTTYTGDRSPISASAHHSTIRCRTDRSGRLPRCVTHPRHPRLPATVHAYSRLATTSHTRTQATAQHAATCPTEPFPGLPIGDKRPFPLLTVSAPNSSQKYNSLQNRRDRRPSHSRPLRRSRRGDVSPISLSPSQRASASLAPMWLRCGCLADLHFCNSHPTSWNMPRPNIACSLANLSFFSSDFRFGTPLTCISATDANPCTPPRHQNRLPEAVEVPSEAASTASTSAPGSLAAV